MEHFDIIKLGLILATQAEVEAMKAENYLRESQGLSLAYGSKSFQEMSEQFKNIVNYPNHRIDELIL